MKRKLELLVCVVTLLILNSTPVLAKEIKLAVSMALPPYIIADDNTGFELDIVREALTSQGHTIKLRYVNFGSLGKQLVHGKVDGAFPITEQSGIKNIFYSDYHVTYQNVAIALKKNNLGIKSVKDLGKYKIIAFQGAPNYLGPAFKTVSKVSPKYKEMAKQEVQVASLFLGRTEVVVMDKNIFQYFRQNTKKVDTSAEITLFPVFPPTQYKTGFTSEKIRDNFNRGLAALKKSGEYDRIIKRYLK